MSKIEYRIVRKFDTFFSEYYYEVERRVQSKFLWWNWDFWKYEAGNSLDRSPKREWFEVYGDMEIIEDLNQLNDE